MPDEIKLDEFEGQEEKVDGQTSNINLDEKSDEEIDEEEADTKKAEIDWESDDNPYKVKYGASSKEVNEVLLPKIKTFEGLTAAEQAKAEKLAQDLEEAMTKLKAEKPETYDNLTLHKSVTTLTQQLAEMKEKSEMNEFIADTPDAKPFREALKAHARAFPSKPLVEIWNENFKEVAEARKGSDDADKKKKKESAPDKGKGGATKEHDKPMTAGMTTEEFNKLPVAKRKELLIKAGVSM